MSYIGPIGVVRLDPDNHFDLAKAKEMFKKRYDPIMIKIETGWERGIDGFWRYEIPDPFMDTTFIEDFVKPRFGQAINIAMIMKDKQLLDAYPSFQNLVIFAMYYPRNGTAGYYNPSSNGMVISMGTPSDDFEYQIDGVLLHEIQHLIQEIEGFAKGGDPKMIGYRKYHRLAGEVEARNICHRHLLTDEDRLRKLRTDTQDVPDNEQIVKFR